MHAISQLQTDNGDVQPWRTMNIVPHTLYVFSAEDKTWLKQNVRSEMKWRHLRIPCVKRKIEIVHCKASYVAASLSSILTFSVTFVLRSRVNLLTSSHCLLCYIESNRPITNSHSNENNQRWVDKSEILVIIFLKVIQAIEFFSCSHSMLSKQLTNAYL